MIELIYRAFNALSPPIKKSSLLYSKNSNNLSILIFYINDFFEDFESFKE